MPTDSIALMTLWVAPLGLTIGLVLGGLGGGGAILTVPILVYLLGQTPRAATTGSLIIVGLTSLVGIVPHQRAGRVRFAEGLTFGVLGVVGSVAGTRASASVPPPVLMSAFSVLMLIVAGLMTRKRLATPAVSATATPVFATAGGSSAMAGATSPVVPGSEPEVSRPRRRNVVIAATGVGLLTGFFGVGGGFAVVPALVLALGFTMPTAVGTSLLVIAINSATALASRFGAGVELDWPLILTFSAFGAMGSVLGGKLVHRINPRTLSLGFTVLLVVVAAYVAYQNVPALF